MPTASSAERPDSVRLALAEESVQIARIQRHSWEQLLPAAARAHALASLTAQEMTEQWHSAISRPPDARLRTLVAVESGRVVGFSVCGPSADPDATLGEDGEVAEFVIDPPAQRRGHGSRLMNACIDTLKADGFQRAQHWQIAGDDIRRKFFISAGWAPDGAHQELAVDTGEAIGIKQIRLHTIIAE